LRKLQRAGGTTGWYGVMKSVWNSSSGVVEVPV